MSVIAKAVMKCTVIETLETSVDSASDKSVTHDQFNLSDTYQSDTTVPATKVSAQIIALIAGAKTLDLTALVGANGATVVGSGLKLQFWMVKNLGAAAMTFSFGAANPYLALGAGFTFILLSGQRAMFFLNDASPDVAGGAKNIDVAGTLVQTFQNLMVLG